MTTTDQIALWALVVSILSLLASWIPAVLTWRKAGNAKATADNAAGRAEDALAIATAVQLRIQTHLSGREERERAELEAGAILDGWIQRLRAHRQEKGRDYSMHVEVTSLAHELALDRLRERKAEFYVSMIDRPAGKPSAAIVLGELPRPVISTRY